jgi:hypothetical protein
MNEGRILLLDISGLLRQLIDLETGMIDACRGFVARSGKSLTRDQIRIGSYKPNQRRERARRLCATTVNAQIWAIGPS